MARRRLVWSRTLIAALLLVCWAAVVSAAEPVEVQISGLEGGLLQNAQLALAPPPGLIKDGQVDRAWLERFARQTPGLVRDALEPFGYFEPEIATHLVTVAAGRYRLEVAVTPGAPVRVASLQLTLTGPGRGEPDLQRLARDFPLKVGEVLRQDLYEAGKGSLKSRAIDLGYLDANFVTHRLAVSRAGHRADIDLVLATGPLYFFGLPLIHGAPDYPDRFLLRYLDFRTGERFAYTKLGQTQVNYLDSDRFKEVLISPRRDLAKGQDIPIGIQLVPSARIRLRPGIGYGTDTGPRGALRYQDVNIFHLGHELKIEGGVSQVKQSLGADYLMPSPTALDNLTAVHLNYDREITDTYTSRKLSTELERVHGFGGNLLGSVYLRLLQEDYRIGGVDNRSQLVLPGLRLTWRQVSDPIRPREGYRIKFEARGSHPALGSDTQLLQFLGNAYLLQPLPWRLSLLGRFQGGATLQSDRLAEIPASLRFFAGGDQSVRGYPYQSLGPRDATGQVVGGKNLVFGSLELERAIADNWGVAAFYDAGNAFNSLAEFEWAQGAGLGLRYYTLVGPIRLDLARRVGETSGAYRVHISVGFAW